MDGQIFALCERDTLALGGLMAGRRFTVLVAHGRDGNWASALLAALGCHVVRGSTRRGGTRALLQVTRSAQATNDPVGMVVDGPLGPAGVAKPGVVLCGLKSGRPVRALGVASRWSIRFPGTWSGLYLPLPFSTVMVTYSEPGSVDSIDEVEHGTRTLTEQLAVARQRADQALEWTPTGGRGVMIARASADSRARARPRSSGHGHRRAVSAAAVAAAVERRDRAGPLVRPDRLGGLAARPPRGHDQPAPRTRRGALARRSEARGADGVRQPWPEHRRGHSVRAPLQALARRVSRPVRRRGSGARTPYARRSAAAHLRHRPPRVVGARRQPRRPRRRPARGGGRAPDRQSVSRCPVAPRPRAPATEWIDKHGATSEALARLRRGEDIAMLLDEHGGPRGVFVPFFGRVASTRKTPAVLSLATGAPIVVGACIRRPGRPFLFRLALLEADRSLPPDEAIRDLTARIVATYEAWIRDAPLQWRWIHWRWKATTRRQRRALRTRGAAPRVRRERASTASRDVARSAPRVTATMLLIVTDRWDPSAAAASGTPRISRASCCAGEEVNVLCRSRVVGRRSPSAALPIGRRACSRCRRCRTPRTINCMAAARRRVRRRTRIDAVTSGARCFAPRSRSIAAVSGCWPTRHRLLAGATALMAFSDADATRAHRAPRRGARTRPACQARRRSRTVPSSRAPEAGERHARGRCLAFVGHNFALKGLRTAILAIARLQRAGVEATLTVAGRGAANPYARLAAREGVADRVRFAGQLSQDQVADLYRRSDALVHPTFYDPFPRVVIEALACGCPGDHRALRRR